MGDEENNFIIEEDDDNYNGIIIDMENGGIDDNNYYIIYNDDDEENPNEMNDDDGVSDNEIDDDDEVTDEPNEDHEANVNIIINDGNVDDELNIIIDNDDVINVIIDDGQPLVGNEPVVEDNLEAEVEEEKEDEREYLTREEKQEGLSEESLDLPVVEVALTQQHLGWNGEGNIALHKWKQFNSHERTVVAIYATHLMGWQPDLLKRAKLELP